MVDAPSLRRLGGPVSPALPAGVPLLLRGLPGEQTSGRTERIPTGTIGHERARAGTSGPAEPQAAEPSRPRPRPAMWAGASWRLAAASPGRPSTRSAYVLLLGLPISAEVWWTGAGHAAPSRPNLLRIRTEADQETTWHPGLRGAPDSLRLQRFCPVHNPWGGTS